MQFSKILQSRIFQISILLIVILAIAAGVLFSEKTLALIVNGQVTDLQTRALTVGGALRAAGFDLSQDMQVTPSLNSWLKAPQVIQIETLAQFTVLDGDDVISGTALTRVPQDVLSALEIDFDAEHDRLLYQGAVWANLTAILPPASYYELVVRHPVEIQLDMGEGLIAFYSSANTLGQALAEQGIILQIADRLSLPLDTLLDSDIQVTLEHADIVSVISGDTQTEIFVNAATVGEALAQGGIMLQNGDFTQPALTEPLPNNMEIQLFRVHEELVINQELLNFYTVYQALPDVDIDTQQVVQAGEYGVESQRVRVTYIDGVESTRVVEDAWVAREPVDRIEGYGTNIVIRTLSTPDGTIEYWRAVEVYATSYSPSQAGTDPDAPWFGLTYSGKPLVKGMIGVSTAWWPSMGGTGVYVPGYGYATVEDIGVGFSDRHWIDLGYTDEGYEAWHYWVTLYFLTPVPSADQILWVLP